MDSSVIIGDMPKDSGSVNFSIEVSTNSFQSSFDWDQLGDAVGGVIGYGRGCAIVNEECLCISIEVCQSCCHSRS
jgi:hypothetical protein